MTTNNHPANGPLSLDRLHQISEILSKASAQSDGGNLGYAIADAVKVIDGAIAAFGAEPVGWVTMQKEFCDDERTVITNSIEAEKYSAQCYDLTPLYSSPQSGKVVKLPNEFISNEGIVVQVEKVMAVLAVAGIQYERKGNAFRAAMLQGADGNSPVIQDDVRRMDWLVSKTVDVREPMVYGSHSLFWSQTITDEEDDYHATKLREQIDAAMAVEQAAAQQEVKSSLEHGMQRYAGAMQKLADAGD